MHGPDCNALHRHISCFIEHSFQNLIKVSRPVLYRSNKWHKMFVRFNEQTIVFGRLVNWISRSSRKFIYLLIDVEMQEWWMPLIATQRNIESFVWTPNFIWIECFSVWRFCSFFLWKHKYLHNLFATIYLSSSVSMSKRLKTNINLSLKELVLWQAITSTLIHDQNGGHRIFKCLFSGIAQ